MRQPRDSSQSNARRAISRAPTRSRPARDEEAGPSSRCTVWFWAVLVERVRQLLEELHGDSDAPDGGWVRRSSTSDVQRATILARREVLADSDMKSPARFLREHFAGVTERTLRKVRRYLKHFGFNPHIARRIATSDVARRLATMPTLDWSHRLNHGRRAWTKQLLRMFGKVHILDVGCGPKSWKHWLSCVDPRQAARHFELVTIDWDASMGPDIHADITTWREWLHVELEKRGYGGVRFHIVHFAAECTEYSPFKNRRERDLTYETWLAQCGMQMILELRPLVWCIESAGSGADALQHQPIMKDARMKRRHIDLTYRNLGSWWTNLPKDACAAYGIRPKSRCEALLERVLHLRFDGGGQNTMYPHVLVAQWMGSALEAMLHYEEAYEEPCREETETPKIDGKTPIASAPVAAPDAETPNERDLLCELLHAASMAEHDTLDLSRCRIFAPIF